MRHSILGPWVSLAYTWRLGAVRPQFKSGQAHLPGKSKTKKSLRRRLEGNEFMMDETSPVIMRIRALLLTATILLSSISSVIASDTVTTQDVDISGNHTMTGNYTVSHGTTLTIKPGTTVDMQNFWLKVEGTLIAVYRWAHGAHTCEGLCRGYPRRCDWVEA